jgi:hypothetical protein
MTGRRAASSFIPSTLHLIITGALLRRDLAELDFTHSALGRLKDEFQIEAGKASTGNGVVSRMHCARAR